MAHLSTRSTMKRALSGPVLLVPLEPVVEALGHQLTRSGGTVTVRRQQDQAAIHLELATGLISVNTTPRGVTPDMQLAERDTLLLPFGAVESLTGTHIKLVPGTNRVDISLDTRLDSTALPGADVADEARSTPFTVESLSYELSDRGPLRLEGQAHVGNYNLRGRIETAGGLQNLASQQPALGLSRHLVSERLGRYGWRLWHEFPRAVGRRRQPDPRGVLAQATAERNDYRDCRRCAADRIGSRE